MKVEEKVIRKKKVKDQTRKNRNGWLTINSISGFSRLIQIASIREIEITVDAIEIQVGDRWEEIRRYNQESIDTHLKKMDEGVRDALSGHDACFGKGTEEREARERQTTERDYLECLDRNSVGKNLEERRKGSYGPSISWLKDKDFDCLKQQLESLSDKFALSVDDEQRQM